MQKSYECEVATHIGPESCGAARKSSVEALTGERAGRVFSRVSSFLRDADAVRRSGRPLRAELTERMRKFNLELHPEKTRLLEFGPYAIDQRQWRGEGKPETFNFLGFSVLQERTDKEFNMN